MPVILVVEDEEFIQSLVEETLRGGRLEPAIATCGEEAVTLLKAHSGKYRALVTDTNLKGKMDGWQVAQHAREIESEFPIVYMSGAAAAEWTREAIRTASCYPSRLLRLNFSPPSLIF